MLGSSSSRGMHILLRSDARVRGVGSLSGVAMLIVGTSNESQVPEPE